MFLKKISIPLLLSVSFFLSPILAKADTYNYNIPNDPFFFHSDPNYESYLNSLLAYIDTKGLNNPHYFISWRNNKYEAVIIEGDTFTYTFDYGSFASDLHIRIDNTDVYFVGNSNNTATNGGSSLNYTGNLINFSCNNSSHNCGAFAFVSTNGTIVNGSTDIVNLTYGDNTLTLPNSDNIYTMEEWYNSLYGDTYPLLTSFFNIYIEKLTLLVDYISNSYILLTIFTIFILIFILEILRRFL